MEQCVATLLISGVRYSRAMGTVVRCYALWLTVVVMPGRDNTATSMAERVHKSSVKRDQRMGVVRGDATQNDGVLGAYQVVWLA